jgi:hypothetical protein
MPICKSKMVIWDHKNPLDIYSNIEINVDHGINVDQHSKSRNKCKYSILYLGFEC